jgi:trans-2,3-dihydro-3-hydroxyanthranilate isomerase
VTRRFVICDVFTDRPFEGNQLGVFTDARGLTGEQMQALASEIGFSECTFVLPAEHGGSARIRIFTPAAELPFAGHPCLGTAFVLGAPMQLDEIRLETGAGIVPVRLEREGNTLAFGRMMQPVPTARPYELHAELLIALGVDASELPIEVYDNGVEHVYVVLPTEREVAALEPDMAALRGLGDIGVSCAAGSGTNYTTRVFAPGLGVPEDPATGSAAGPLAVHLASHGRIAWGEEIVIAQGAALGRPSTLFARANGSAEAIVSVEVGGSAVIVARGEFAV